MGSSTKTLGGTSPYRQMGELYSFIIMFNPISFVSPFSLPFLRFFFFFFLSGQASVRSASSVASSLKSKDSEGGRWSVLLCSLPLLPFMPLSYHFLLLWWNPLYPYLPLAIFLRFPHLFFNSPCAFSQGLPRNQRNKRRRLRSKRPILVSLISPLFLFSFPFFFFELSLSPFFFTGVDTGVRDPELVIPEGAVESV